MLTVCSTDFFESIEEWSCPGSKKYASGYRNGYSHSKSVCNLPISNRPCILDTRSNRFVERPCRRRVTEVDWNKSSRLFRNQANRTRASRQYDPRTPVQRKSNRKKAHTRAKGGNVKRADLVNVYVQRCYIRIYRTTNPWLFNLILASNNTFQYVF